MAYHPAKLSMKIGEIFGLWMLYIMTEFGGETRRSCAEENVETEKVEFDGEIEWIGTGG